uniref:Uncharacterized protein n=1 Tax=viral metagenome TaxID=1070528 RepID=A0A6M3LBH6_9ZZZZ
MTSKDWARRMVIEGYLEERKEIKDKAKARAEELKFIFEISLAVGVPFSKAQENIINLEKEIKNFDERRV